MEAIRAANRQLNAAPDTAIPNQANTNPSGAIGAKPSFPTT
jgi:hypothetical protein